ncbi:MAG: cobalt-precorrin-5B (C(1))-methyltransferase CbiD [Methanomethylophilus sp.]
MGAIDEDQAFIYVNGKKLRRGFTTGSCAAAAAKAAAEMLLTDRPVAAVDLLTPKGIPLHLPIENVKWDDGKVSCAVRKDGGDDMDETSGALVFAEVVKREDPGIAVEGGTGIGRITRKGLDQPVGAAAINHVPRHMIQEALEDVCQQCGWKGGLGVTFSVPGGEQIAKRTFNPRLGITGGISILGTSGCVEPMSETALLGSIRAETKVWLASGKKYLLAVPGNYGRDFVHSYPKLEGITPIQCSNFIGDMLDLAVELGAQGLLLVGNLGKLVKLAGGIMNTHSRNADCRMEIMAANAALAGARIDTVKSIMGCISTDDALEVLEKAGVQKDVIDLILPKIEFHMNHRTGGRIVCGAVVFSSEYGMLGMTESAPGLIKKLEGRQ